MKNWHLNGDWKKHVRLMALLIAGMLMLFSGVASAEQEAIKEKLKLADDITKETIVGPGSVQVNTGKDLLMSFGATIRVIPTSESNYDFGMSDEADNGFLFGNLGKEFFRIHANESGQVKDGYIRNEDKLHFNVMPKDRKWSFYAALEYDRAWDTSSVDSRGGRDNDNSNFGLERLNATMALPWNMRFHAGFDIWHLDAFDGAGMVYADDNPGLWLTGDYETINFNMGYFKLEENDFQTSPGDFSNAKDADRDLYAGYLTWKPTETQQVNAFYAFDRIRSVPVGDLLGGATDGVFGISTDEIPQTDSHHIGAYWIGNFGNLEMFLEGTYQLGSADGTGLSNRVGPDGVTRLEDDYDISAYGLVADIAFECKGLLTGFPLKPHLGIMYTSGDDDPYDDELQGYNGVNNVQRFSRRWGGENTIIGDTNFLLGTALYGYQPEFYGNGTPVFTGGLQNFSGGGNGRGDNPGLTMVSTGLTVAPKRFLIYKTNVNYFRWNEDFFVQNFVSPVDLQTGAPIITKVDSGYMGTEWDNELTLALSRNTVIKGQASFMFPGDAVEDLTEALGAKSDDTAMRFAAEFIWNF